MKKKLLLSLLLLLILSSCEPSAVRDGRYAYEAYFHEVLKDPASFVVYNEQYEVDSTGVRVLWTLDYGAKNSFGGMKREKIEFTTIGKVLWANDRSYDYR